jgi:hypothetical protein
MFVRAIVVVTTLWAAVAAHGDEAVRRDGSRVNGTLTLGANGRFAFRSDRDESVVELDRIRFVAKPQAAPQVPIWHQVRLANGETLLAELRKLDATHLHVQPAWGATLAIPRTAIERVGNEPGWRPVFFDSFDNDLANWTKSGEPRIEGGQLVLSAAGQAVEAKLKNALAVGRVGVTFRSTTTKTRRMWLDLAFNRDGKPSPVRIELIGPGEQYSVNSSAKTDHEGKLKRDAGMHRLTAEFDRDRLHIFLDELVLWSQPTGPGELHAVLLIADGEGSEASIVDDVLIARAERPADPRPWADLTADAVRSPDGDETFGSLVAGFTLETKARKLKLAWPDTTEFTFRRGPVAENATTGEHVRVRIRSADGIRDVLDGAVKAFDAKSFVLSHAVLGDLTIPRDRVEEIRLRFFGRRMAVDSSPHHLGTRPAFGFAMPKPEGPRFNKMVRVDTIPVAGFVVLDAASVGARGTIAEVLLNGEPLGDLSRLADRAEPVVREYRLAVPKGGWRRGDNELEVRLRPTEPGGRVTGIDLRAVRLEFHVPR